MVAERGHLVPAPSAMARGSPGSLNFGGWGLCDLETADSTVSKGRPSAPGLIRPAGRPEKNQGTCRIAPLFSTTKWLIEDGRVQLPSRPPSGNQKNLVRNVATARHSCGVQVHQSFLLDNDA